MANPIPRLEDWSLARRRLGWKRAEYRCSECGYGIVAATLPACPMCRGETWALIDRRSSSA